MAVQYFQARFEWLGRFCVLREATRGRCPACDFIAHVRHTQGSHAFPLRLRAETSEDYHLPNSRGGVILAVGALSA